LNLVVIAVSFAVVRLIGIGQNIGIAVLVLCGRTIQDGRRSKFTVPFDRRVVFAAV
jgi:hypothetical protein